MIEHGANVAAVNNDGDLPSDIAESSELEELLEQHIEDQGIIIFQNQVFISVYFSKLFLDSSNGPVIS